MTTNRVVPEIEKLLQTPAGTLRGEQNLKDFPRWDSLAMIEFIAMADEDFGKDLYPDAVRGCRTVGDLVALVEGETPAP